MSEAVAVEARGMKPWVLVLMQGIVAMIFGALLMFVPAKTTLVLVQILAWYWIIGGAFAIVAIVADRTMWGFKLAFGMVGILAGIWIIGAPLWSALAITSFMVIVLGAVSIVNGGIDMFRAFKGGGVGEFFIGLLGAFLGILLLAYSARVALATPSVIGFLMFGFGIAAVIFSFRVKKLS